MRATADHTDLGPIAAAVDAALDRLDRARVVERIWTKDHTVWSPEPREVADRLGWLDAVHAPPPHDRELDAFVARARDDRFRDAVLLGMGGSSLGAEALRASFGERPGGMRLHVLDSTHPAWVRRVRRAVDPAATLFVVASKSGTTAEVDALRRFFWAEAAGALGADAAPRHFVAVTDPGSPLAERAEREGWRHVFVNPPDVGGRFSVLSRFGLVPAALAGIDPRRLLASGHAMAGRCSPAGPLAENPGARLGAVLGAAALAGRDQLTLMTSERLSALGLWVEQLVAESTGKDGAGILPVDGEPWADVGVYGPDRLFVAVRWAGDDTAALERRLGDLARAGHPVVDEVVEDLYDLGGELFRWQLATAVAGHLLGVQPFDQPDVEATKRETRRVLAEVAAGAAPATEAGGDLARALARERPRYLAIMAYTDASPALEAAIAELRRAVLATHGVTTTFGYGPRFLHSTGQLHKGGPPGGLHLQLTAGLAEDLPIPGETYGFATLLRAQRTGDAAALRHSHRRVLTQDLGDDPPTAVDRLRRELTSTSVAAGAGESMKPERIQEE